MYLYHFSQYAGTDRIFLLPERKEEQGKTGDVVDLGAGHYGLLLGNDLAWKEQVTQLWRGGAGAYTVIQELLSENSRILLHRFVNERYTTYKNSIPLRCHNIEDIIKRKQLYKTPKKKKTYTNELGTQELFVFPDVWTMEQIISSLGDNAKILHGKSTKKQKSEAFWGIKTGNISTLACTYSQLFQDWHHLQKITLIDQHKRRYASHQDPRYKVGPVIDKMGEIYDAEIVRTGIALGRNE